MNKKPQYHHPFKKLNFFENNISTLDIALFFRQLATLIAAGIPIVQCCEILKKSQEKKSLYNLIGNLKNEMEAGKNLVIGLQKYPLHFDSLICHLIHAGEQTGTLETMLKRIAAYKENSIKLRNQIKQALFYPALIFIVAIIITFIMLAFIVPRFAELFEHMHSQLPAFTCFIIFLSKFLCNNLILLILISLGLVSSFYLAKSSPRVKKRFDYYILKIPFLSSIIKKIILIRITKSLATTYAAGVPITEALKIIANISGNHEYRVALKHLQLDIASGKQLHIAMQRNSLFLPMAIQLIKVGEESGKLDPMLEKIAEIYERDIDYLINNLSHMLEPLIMIILGVLIGGLIIAMYLPIFKLGTVI